MVTGPGQGVQLRLYDLTERELLAGYGPRGLAWVL